MFCVYFLKGKFCHLLGNGFLKRLKDSDMFDQFSLITDVSAF